MLFQATRRRKLKVNDVRTATPPVSMKVEPT
jgi:hypothetical protein